MKKNSIPFAASLALLLFAGIGPASAFYARVQTIAASPVSGVAVTFSRFDTTAYSNDSGIVSFYHTSAVIGHGQSAMPATLRLTGRNIVVDVHAQAAMDLRIYTLSGRSVFSKSQILQPGRFAAALPVIAAGIYILKARIGNNAFVKKINPTNGCQWRESSHGPAFAAALSKKASAGDTAIFNKTGFITLRRPFATYSDNLGAVVMDSSVHRELLIGMYLGYRHSMYLQQDHTLWGAGRNDSSQLALGNDYQESKFVKIMDGVLTAAVGKDYSMIVKQDSTLWSIGVNGFGQLGVGDSFSSKKNVLVQVTSGVTGVFAGQCHTMMIKKDGSLWACGNNWFGQLGDSTIVNRYSPVFVMNDVASVAVGVYHTMILKKDNTLWACGQNYYGQLGDGTCLEKHVPVQIMSSVSAVCAGEAHTMVLKQDNTLWAMGDNSCGQLGDGTFSYKPTPLQVMSGVSAVSAGGHFTIIMKQNGSLWVVGDNRYGQLGDGTNTNRFAPIQIMSEVAAAWAGSNYAIIMKQNGSLWGTGDDSWGQLGIASCIFQTDTPMDLNSSLIGLTVSGGSGSGSFYYQCLPNITANDSSSSHRFFDHWGGPDSALVNNDTAIVSYVTMPNHAVVVKAVFRDMHALSVVNGAGSGWYDGTQQVSITADDSTSVKKFFDHWGGSDSGLVSSIFAAKATFRMPNRDARVAVIYSGLNPLIVQGGSGSGSYAAKTFVNIIAGDSSYINLGFDHWAGPDSASVVSDTGRISTFIMPNRPAAITAVYTASHTLTINGGKGSGSYIPKKPISISANDSTVVFRAFDHWGGPDSGSVTNDTNPTTTITMPGKAAMVSAVFSDMHVLTVIGGSFYGASAYAKKGGTMNIYPIDSTAAHRAFDHWGGPDSMCVVNDTIAQGKIIMPDRPATVKAMYRDMYYVYLTNGWSLGWNDRGKNVSINVNDSIAEKKVFDHWAGPDSALALNDTAHVTTFVMPARNVSFSAIYVPGAIVTFDKNGGDNNASPQQSPLIVPGRPVRFQPGPPTRKGFYFAGWNRMPDGSGAAFFDTSIVKSDITVFAQWTQGFSKVSAISAGDAHSMFIGQDGTLWAMGWNQYGQLGNGRTGIDAIPKPVMTNVSEVSASTNTTMVIKSDGSLWGTGYNFNGMLGDGTDTQRLVPVKVMNDVAAVSSGQNTTAILKKDGTLWVAGTLYPFGTDTSSKTPVQVMNGVSAVSARSFHSMVIKQDGTLWAAGANKAGQLGTGDTLYRKNPIQIMDGVLSVSTGSYFIDSGSTMIIKKDHTLWATGSNQFGQLGTGDKIRRTIPVEIMSGVAAVSVGSGFTMILKQDGSLWATGFNYWGQLGDKTKIDKYFPVNVMNGVSAVSAGGDFTLILKQDGTVWAVGSNYSGELGDGTTTDRIVPIQVVPQQ